MFTDNSRVIPVLLLRGSGFVKTKKFCEPKYLGEASNIVRIFNEKMVDEIVILDIDASRLGQEPNYQLIEKLCSECFVPLSYGGGISSFQQAEKLFAIGVEKVIINSAVCESNELIKSISSVYGSQAVVVAVDVIRQDSEYRIRRSSDNKVIEKPFDAYLQRAQADGAGELLVHDVERDGTREGYDQGLFKFVASISKVPVIALGGASDSNDLQRIFSSGISAAAAGSLFVFAGRKDAVLISVPFDRNGGLAAPMFQENVTKFKSQSLLRKPNRVCAMTVLDDTDPDFRTDNKGTSVLAKSAVAKLKEKWIVGDKGERIIAKIVNRAKEEGRGKEYDCLIGLSGGVDSSYVALKLKQLGLRPLALHLDNGWNSNTAVLNIKSIVERLDIDLETYVINWEDVKDLQRAFFKASVPDVEVITDHAILAAQAKVARKYGIKTIILGNNIATESILPAAWHYSKRDAKHIRKIHGAHGEKKLTNFPFYELKDAFRDKFLSIIHMESILSYLPFDKKKALAELKSEIDYVPYPRKHGESKFTQIYQEYYLPRKFGFDKRKAHYSSLIISKQMTRAEAIELLDHPLYDDTLKAEQDVAYLCRKLDFTAEDWREIMMMSPVSHDSYPGYYWMLKKLRELLAPVKALRKLIRGPQNEC